MAGTDEGLLEVSDFSQQEYGISAVSARAMTNYGNALLVIAGADGKVGPAELEWLTKHQRKFGAPEEVIAGYRDFDYASADLTELLDGISVDVDTWSASNHLIYHAIQICSADGTYGERERHKVRSAARTMGVPIDIVLTLEALVDMELAIVRMRKALFHVDTE
jgi:uncharacterized tellurite resistance protein B-like protein